MSYHDWDGQEAYRDKLNQEWYTAAQAPAQAGEHEWSALKPVRIGWISMPVCSRCGCLASEMVPCIQACD